ncbi:PKD domain-containing protein [Luteibaculum oceani]|uniref:PKD domain-containing protein n=1 Tax=Luteibaculum oceani TaxID=1294296 RepID=A0A5C6V8W0_9FLAO|nr:PKD domain-containing protein [Luteibaculum oceani]TXC81507.1 PKD domain-containing protein [Luteibaculum oceani]
MKRNLNHFKVFLTILLAMVATGIFAQTEPCSFDKVHQQQLQVDPIYKAAVDAQNKAFQRYIKEKATRADKENEKAPVITIPMVFHIIHLGENVGEGSNLTDEQIISSVEGLNIQYRNQNPDGSIYDPDGTDLEFEFCLAKRDPNGQPTTGINRVDGRSVANYESQGIISSNEVQIKDLSRWDNTKYYNVWVVAMIDGQNPWGGGTKGYAYFPGAAASRDGTVILFNETGYDPDGSRGLKGNGQLAGQSPDNGTMVHEVGHSFALYHTFEGANSSGGNCPPAEGAGECSTKGDRVCDTDPHDSHLGTCKQGTDNNPCTGNPYGINVTRNYMNYTNCGNLIYTPGQRDRIRFTLENSRSYFNQTGTPAACVPVFEHDIAILDIFSPVGFYCDENVIGEIKVKNNGQNTITDFQIEYGVNGNILNTYTWTGSLASQAEEMVVLPSINVSVGAHNFFAQVKANSINGGNADEFNSNDYQDQTFEVIEGSTVTVKVWDYEASDIIQFVTTSGNVVIDFPLKNASGDPFEQDFCLPNDDCYKFVYKDAVFVHPQVGGTPPSYEIIEPSKGFVIESGYDNNPPMTGNPYDDETEDFCMPFDPGFITADFYASRTIVPVNETVTFFDLSKNSQGESPTSWEWDFGDGSTKGTLQVQNHIYTTPGVYTVSLVADNNVLPDTAVKKHYIRVVSTITGCDKYNNLLAGEISTTYNNVGGQPGSLPGQNAYNLREYAERFFADSASKLQKLELRVKSMNIVDPTRNFVITIYDGGFTGDAPGKVLAEERVPLSDLTSGVNTILLEDLPQVDQFFFVGFKTEDPADEVLIGLAPYRGDDDFSNTAFADSSGSWDELKNFIPEASATSFDIKATLSFIPYAEGFTSVPKVCAGIPFEINASFSENASTYKWNLPTNASKTSSNKEVDQIAFIEGGNYSLELVVSGGCSLKDTTYVDIQVDSVPKVTIEVTDDICNQQNGTATAVKRGGSGANDFTWSPDPTNKGNKLYNLTPGNYTYTWSDEACGKTNVTQPFTIKAVSKVPDFNIDVKHTQCGFYNGTLTAVTDGLTNYTYEWTKSSDPSFIKNTAAIGNLSPGTYTAKVSFAGCSPTTKIAEVFASDSTLGTVSEIPAVCAGEVVTLTAQGGDSLKWFFMNGELFLNNQTTVVVDTPNTARYRVIFYGDPGCTLEKITGVTIKPAAMAFAKVATEDSLEYRDTAVVNIALGELALFSSSGSVTQGVEWDFGDGSPVKSTRNPSHRYQQEGMYLVTLFANNNGCTDQDSVWVLAENKPITGMDQLEQIGVSIYPNPFKSIINIKANTTGTFEIVDLTGKTLLSGNLDRRLTLDMEPYSSGIYFVKFNTDRGRATTKITRID